MTSQRAGAWGLLALGIGAQIAYPLVHGEARAQLSIVVVALMGAAAVLGAVAALGWRIGLSVVGAAAGIGFAADAIGTTTGYPFGGYAYDDGLGPRLFAVPVIIALAWAMGAWPAIAAARRLRPGGTRADLLARIGLAALGLWAWDLFLDPQMVADGRWRWDRPEPGLPGVDGVPLTNYGGWLLVSVAIAAAGCALADRAARRGASGSSAPESGTVSSAPSAPSALSPRPRPRPHPRPRPRIEPGEAQYLWTWLSSTLAHAAFLHLPASAMWGALGMGAIGVPLMIVIVRDARRDPATRRAGRAASEASLAHRAPAAGRPGR